MTYLLLTAYCSLLTSPRCYQLPTRCSAFRSTPRRIFCESASRAPFIPAVRARERGTRHLVAAEGAVMLVSPRIRSAYSARVLAVRTAAAVATRTLIDDWSVWFVQASAAAARAAEDNIRRGLVA